MSDQHLQMLLGGFMPVNSPSSNRSSSSISSGTSRVQSTLPGSRAEPASSSNSNLVPTTPAAAESSHISQEELTKAPSKKATEESHANGGTKMQFTDFQNILGNIGKCTLYLIVIFLKKTIFTLSIFFSSHQAQGEYASGRSELDLSEILSLDVMAPILANKSIQEKLIKYLPDSEILPKNEAELRKHLTTPQFKKVIFLKRL